MPVFQTYTSPRFRVIAHSYYHLKPLQVVEELCGPRQNRCANTVINAHVLWQGASGNSANYKIPCFFSIHTLKPKTFGRSNFRTKSCPKVCFS